MTRHIESYRYEVQHGHDADFVAYQRKSSHGVWQTIAMWMIPQPTGHRVLGSRCTAFRHFGRGRVSQRRISDFEVIARNQLHCTRINV